MEQQAKYLDLNSTELYLFARNKISTAFEKSRFVNNEISNSIILLFLLIALRRELFPSKYFFPSALHAEFIETVT